MLGNIIKKAKSRDVVGKNRVTWIKNTIVEMFQKGFCPPYVKDLVNNGEEVTIDETYILGVPLCFLDNRVVDVFVGKNRVGAVMFTSVEIEELRKIKEDN